MDQPLARLAFDLLEPRSDEGLFNWNVLETPWTASRRCGRSRRHTWDR